MSEVNASWAYRYWFVGVSELCLQGVLGYKGGRGGYLPSFRTIRQNSSTFLLTTTHHKLPKWRAQAVFNNQAEALSYVLEAKLCWQTCTCL